MQKFKILMSTLVTLAVLFTGCKKDEIYEQDQFTEDEVNENVIPSSRTCATMNVLERQIAADPSREEALQAIEKHIETFANSAENRATLHTIPVVVHVLYKTAAQNISEAQIQSQLDVLNEDFRRTNSDADNTWSQAADTEIEFCLATVDPNGNTTNGITRTQTTVTTFNADNDNMKSNSSGGKSPWNTSEYLNMWVCNLPSDLLGYAQFPGGPAATDGVVMGYKYFGTEGTAVAPFNLGRTTTHEVGHYFNLYHIWGDGACNVDDNVSDTPASDAANYGCTAGHSSCGSTDMVQNYMDYSDDACMNLFTAGQKTRMRALLGTGGSRVGLANSNACSGSGGGNGGGGGTPTPTCSDGVQNGTETGVDCGGSCAPCSTSSTELLKVRVKTDNYGSETTWKLKDASGTVLLTGGPYPDNSTVWRGKNKTVPNNACYTIVMQDSYGDGICCENGTGWYQVLDGNHERVFAGNGNFGYYRARTFCIGTGQLADGTTERIEYDEPVAKSIDINALSNGRYEVNIENAIIDGELLVKDQTGNVIKTIALEEQHVNTVVDLSGYNGQEFQFQMGTGTKTITKSLNITE